MVAQGTSCVAWKYFPSVFIDGAMTILVLCISLIVLAPQTPIPVRKAPTRFWVPSVTEVGPNRICGKVVLVPTLTLVPRGSDGWGWDIPQW